MEDLGKYRFHDLERASRMRLCSLVYAVRQRSLVKAGKRGKGKKALLVRGSKTAGTSSTTTAPAAKGVRAENTSLENEKHKPSTHLQREGEAKTYLEKGKKKHISYWYIPSGRREGGEKKHLENGITLLQLP